MKICILATLLIVNLISAKAAVINWTNINGGYWSDAANWNLHRVPGSADDVIITASGTYIVTNNAGAVVNSLTLGGSNGRQTLDDTGVFFGIMAFTSQTSIVNTNGILEWAGTTADFPGGLIIDGQFIWTGISSQIESGSKLTVLTNGLLVLAGTNGAGYIFFGTLTNAGTIRLISGNLQLYGGGGTNGLLVNLPGGLVDIPADNSIYGSGVIMNQGTVRKSGGINGIYNHAPTYIYPTFTNLGKLDVQAGAVYLTGNYSLTGGTLNLGINNLTNYGVIELSGNPVALDGTVSANFNNGYLPKIGNIFNILYYNSETGVFVNYYLPKSATWQTNYNFTYFSLMVMNVLPKLNISFFDGDARKQQEPGVIISWPSPSSGFVLQTNSDLTTTNWATDNLSVSSDGTNKSVNLFINPQEPELFFRLSKP
jgi:hypothetical protein